MVTKLLPEVNKVYFINQYTLFHILEGNGGIQVDFKNYHDWEDKIIFLEKGQYIKFLSENFIVRQIEFPDRTVFHNKEVRVLFKHLVSLGYINFNECIECQKYLANTVFSSDVKDIIDISSKQWYWQNPFHANKKEYHIIFDVKDIIDKQFHNHLSNSQLSSLIKQNGFDAQALVKKKVGISVKGLLNHKRLLESKKEIAFTDKSIKEISYKLGYNDPAYFNRVFKSHTGKSPNQFRKDYEYSERNTFTQELYELLLKYHTQQRSLEFYAEKMHLTIKTLSVKVQEELNISLGQLIRQLLIKTAKELLRSEEKINAIAFQLGFEEANHFSAFFKHHTGISPSDFKKKYN